jgi:O-antigen ligase
MTWANRFSFILICFTIVFMTIAYGGVHQPILAIFYILSAALLVLWVIDAYKVGAARVDRSVFQLILLAAAIYGLIQVIPFGYYSDPTGPSDIPYTISADPFSTSLNVAHAIALLLFFGTLLVALNSTARIQRLVNVITIFGFIFAFYAILQSVLSPGKIYGIYEVKHAPPFGSFVNRHNFAAFVEMTIAFPLAFLFTGLIKSDRRLLFVTTASLMGVALLLSGSRGGFVALAAELFLLVIVTRSSGKNQLFIRVGFAALLVLSVVAGAIFVGGESSLSRFLETAQSSDVTTSRAHIWSVTLKMIAANMPFGAGLGAFGVAYTPFDTYSGLERVEQAHNDYLQLVSDMGVVGIALGAFFLFSFFKTARKNIQVENGFRRSVAIGAMCGCFAILVHSLFDFVLHTTAISLMFITLISLLVASGKNYPDDVEDRKHDRLKKMWVTPLPAHTRKSSTSRRFGGTVP